MFGLLKYAGKLGGRFLLLAVVGVYASSVFIRAGWQSISFNPFSDKKEKTEKFWKNAGKTVLEDAKGILGISTEKKENKSDSREKDNTPEKPTEQPLWGGDRPNGRGTLPGGAQVLESFDRVVDPSKIPEPPQGGGTVWDVVRELEAPSGPGRDPE